MTHRARLGPTLPVLLLIVAALAGCLGQLQPGSGAGPADDAIVSDPDDGDRSRSSNGTSSGSDDGNGTEDPGSGGDGDAGNGTRGNGTDDGDGNATDGSGGGDNGTYAPGWPAPSDARIRPGVKVRIDVGQETFQCTAGFVFSSPDNRTLYLSLASHCVGGKALGETVSVPGVGAVGPIVYCSWRTIDDTEDCPGGTGTTGDGIRDLNDLALVRIRDAHRGTVHPAMLGYGGPTGTADTTALATADKVLSYGNSGLRDGFGTVPDPAGSAVDPREGYVVGSDPKATTIYFLPPGISGDSGSPVVTADGAAIGVLSASHRATRWNLVSDLDHAIPYMEDQTDLEVELKTWALASSGVLP